MNLARRIWLTALPAAATLFVREEAAAQTPEAKCADEAARLARNKQNVRAFYNLAFNQSKPAEAIAHYAGATYIHHNPEVKDGKEGFIEYFEGMAKRYGTNKRVEFVRMLAQDDLVTVHCRHWFKEWHGDSVWAGMDIFRLDAQGKIVEHWDVLQKVPRNMAHGNGIF